MFSSSIPETETLEKLKLPFGETIEVFVGETMDEFGIDTIEVLLITIEVCTVLAPPMEWIVEARVRVSSMPFIFSASLAKSSSRDATSISTSFL